MWKWQLWDAETTSSPGLEVDTETHWQIFFYLDFRSYFHLMVQIASVFSGNNSAVKIHHLDFPNPTTIPALTFLILWNPIRDLPPGDEVAPARRIQKGSDKDGQRFSFKRKHVNRA